MQTPDFCRSPIVAVLEPPLAVAAEISRYRRRLFASLGESSARAFPEVVAILALRETRDPSEQRRGRRLLRAARSRELARAWIGASGAFASGRPAFARGALYLGLEGPLEALAASLARLPAGLGLAVADDAVSPIAPRSGFFLCAPRDGAAALAAAESLEPPAFSFSACRIAVLRFRLGRDALEAHSWEELCGAWRARDPRPKARAGGLA